MKPIQYLNKKDVFSEWIDDNLSLVNKSPVFCPQICYDWNSADPIHIIFEKKKKGYSFDWPWDSNIYLPWPYTNIDFTSDSPKLLNGVDWNYETWHINALNCNLQNAPRSVPSSFWNWRLQTRPQGNLTCDLDVLFKKDDTWIGVEATEIWYVEENENIKYDCFQHVKNLIHYRKAFNFKALLAQNSFMRGLNGEHYFILHRINKDKLVEDKVMVLPLDINTISILENNCTTRDEVKRNLGDLFKFTSLSQFFSH